jgi:hypothetical protein
LRRRLDGVQWVVDQQADVVRWLLEHGRGLALVTSLVGNLLLRQLLMVATDVVENCLELELILRNIGDIVLSEAVAGGCMSS